MNVTRTGTLRKPYEGIALFALLIGAIVGVLFIADNWSSAHTDKCALQLPLKWLGCAMAAHENLAGGLIAAAGALYAAWWAAGAVWQQIEDARAQIALAEQQREVVETDSFMRVISYYTRLLRSFEAAGGHEDIKYVNGLDALYKSGNLVPFFGSLPDDHRSLVRDVWERLSNLNYALVEARKVGQGGTGDLKTRNEINTSIGEVVENILANRELANDAVRHAKHI
ncbi:hypothetical protein [Bradyrhizobium sp. NAS96.2]|uniref:hypothetical protein n=1 Tax=Bradyrhizobium sp. NAS96.2 TaxID=1680160 RepID=UPI000939EE6C|nr:hypothetical protein [Bradyrhizobium sp. NAS96.2]OKO83745.1 hypothetical protein AC628_01165 [Bradyrhizobium sp. NAS96.2]